jgi:hypothetical protein
MENKQYLSSLKVLVNTPKQWGAFNELLESNIHLYENAINMDMNKLDLDVLYKERIA